MMQTGPKFSELWHRWKTFPDKWWILMYVFIFAGVYVHDLTRISYHDINQLRLHPSLEARLAGIVLGCSSFWSVPGSFLFPLFSFWLWTASTAGLVTDASGSFPLLLPSFFFQETVHRLIVFGIIQVIFFPSFTVRCLPRVVISPWRCRRTSSSFFRRVTRVPPIITSSNLHLRLSFLFVQVTEVHHFPGGALSRMSTAVRAGGSPMLLVTVSTFPWMVAATGTSPRPMISQFVPPLLQLPQSAVPLSVQWSWPPAVLPLVISSVCLWPQSRCWMSILVAASAAASILSVSITLINAVVSVSTPLISTVVSISIPLITTVIPLVSVVVSVSIPLIMAVVFPSRRTTPLTFVSIPLIQPLISVSISQLWPLSSVSITLIMTIISVAFALRWSQVSTSSRWWMVWISPPVPLRYISLNGAPFRWRGLMSICVIFPWAFIFPIHLIIWPFGDSSSWRYLTRTQGWM